MNPPNVPDDFVYPDGVTKRDVLAAIQVAGLVENYRLTDNLRIQYNLDVCCRCASSTQPRVPLLDMNFNEWGTVCEPCAREIGQQVGHRWRQSL